MNKSKQDTLSRNHQFTGKKNKTGGKKPGKPWKKHISTGDEAVVEKTKRKLLPVEDLRSTKMANGFADVKNLKKSNLQKLFGQKEKSSSTQRLPQGTTRKELQTDEKKTDRHSLKSFETKAAKQQTPPEPPKADRQQKRKKSQIDAAVTKAKKKKKRAQSESDSDADDYMDRFFQDVSDGDPEEDMTAPDLFGLVGSEEEEGSDLSGSESIGGGGEEENDGNAMSLEELVDFYGKHRDRATNGGKAAKQKKTDGKAGKEEEKSKSSQGNDWIEEDNDVDLVYDDSDEEKEAACKILVPVGNGRIEQSDDEQESAASSEESGEEGEDDNEWMSLAEYLEEEDTDSDDESVTSDSDDSGSDVDDDESELDDHEFSSDYDSDDSDDLDDSDDEYPSYWDESYDSDEDEDFIAGDEDDLYISRGAAQIYEIDDNQVSFNIDVDSAQIVELPCDNGGRKRSFTTSGTESQEEHDDKASCPKLVPIYDTEGRLIDSPEKLERSKNLEKTASQNPTSVAQSSKVSSSAEPNLVDEDEPLPNVRNLKDLAKQDDAMEEDVDQNAVANSNYRIYDSIDMRMSLLVLKETLYFSGHLTIQPLVGGLEVMGYCLRPGECRSVYAVRGFHSLNLSPRAEATPGSMETIRKVLTRVEKHFQMLHLQEIQENFDPAVSVLVLLQADCNNKKITVVDKYLSEDFLFPRVEFLKKNVFFTTEYLLNVEFYTEHVDKSTSLYRSDPEWDKIDVKKNSKIVVMGGKGSGKSTLCQYLVNKNVAKFKKVVLIDLDIGQPIQHIPETISVTIVDRPLLGVATFSPIKPAKSWLFGSLNIVSSLIFYILNVRQLLRYCEQHQPELANVPWIINTMGYVTDFGEELMAVILRMFSPTDVIQLVSTNKLLAIPNYQHRLTSEFINQYSFNILRSEVQEYVQRKATFKHYALDVCYPKKGFTLNAPKRRFLMLLAHLADILHDTSSEWFNDVKPFCAPLSQLQVLITREDQTLADEQLPSVLNATLVYLCQKVDGGSYECLGIGIVRGVDKNNNVYLLQSLPAERLACVNVLAICSGSLPNAVFLRQSARIQGSIPYVYNID